MRAALVVVALLIGAPAFADGSLALRGAYYKERSTRVQQPMIDAKFEVGEGNELAVHGLIDSITSASPSAGATDGAKFTERRYEVGSAYRHTLGSFRLTGGGRYSTEPDYKSLFGHARLEADLFEKNTTLAFSLAYGRDRLSNEGSQGMISAPIEGRLRTTLVGVSIAQVLSPVVIATVAYDVTRLDGFQENPYRLVPAGGQLELERVPRTRLRHAVALGTRTFWPTTKTTAVGTVRYYADDWGLRALTPELRLIQELQAGVTLRLRYRYHEQFAARFYRDAYDTADPALEPYLTADAKLSDMHTQTVGGKFGVELRHLGFEGTLALARLDATLEWLEQSTYVGNAWIAEVGLEVPLAY